MKQTLRSTAPMFALTLVLVAACNPFTSSPDLRAGGTAAVAAAKRHPNFTLEQHRAMARAIESQRHAGLRSLDAAPHAQRFTALPSRRSVQAAATTGTGPADFLGNLTAIAGTSGDQIALQRQANCALLDFNGTFTGTAPTLYGGVTTASDYQDTLHALAGLTTQADVFSAGCAEATLGIGSRSGAYLGKSTQGLYLFAGVGYDPTTTENALYFASIDAATQAAHSSGLDASVPGVAAIAVGDLNGDGLADVVGLDATAASIDVWLANAAGGVGRPAAYALTGNMTEAAVMADVNGDGKVDVVVATAASAGQETVSVLSGNGDGTFTPGQTLSVTTPSNIHIVDLIAADVRGTGRPDIVASNGVVLLNSGSGTFTQGSAAFAASVSSSGSGPYLAAADFNHDGHIDLALSNGYTVATYLGAGDASFKAGKSYGAIAGSVGYVTATDLDGDGNVDLYFGLANGGFFGGDQDNTSAAYALMGNGDGSFQGAPVLPFVYTGSNLADLNGDGILDAIGVNSDGSLTTYLGDGNGGFAATSTLAISPVSIGGTQYTVNGIDSFAIGDINGDGKPDLAYIASGFLGPTYAPGVFVALGDGHGGFATPTFHAVPSTLPAGAEDSEWSISNLRLADFNGDGKADIVYNYYDISGYAGYDPPPSNIYTGNVVQLGNGDGSFQAAQAIVYRTVPTSGSTGSPTSYVERIVDLDGDGKLDLVFLAQSTTGDFTLSTAVSSMQVALGHGDGSFSTPATVAGPDIMVESFTDVIPASIVVADMNGDGIPDIVAVGSAATTYNLQIAIALGKGDGTFQAPVLTDTIGQYLNNDQQVAVADFNGDGKLDVLITDPYVTTASGIYLGNGDGSLQSTGGPSAIQPVQALFLPVGGATLAQDLNGDGKPDVLSGTTELLGQAGLVAVPGFSVGLGASAATVSAGQSASTTVTVSPSGGFAQTVALSCSGLPAGASCSFSPASLSVNGAAATSRLTITTTAAAAAAGAGPVSPWLGGGVLLAAAGALVLRRRSATPSPRRYAWYAGVALGALALQGCGGGGGGGGGSGGGSGGTPAGTYTVVVAGSAGTTTHSSSYTLTVN